MSISDNITSVIKDMNHNYALLMWPVISFMAILFISGVIGNFLVIAVYATKRNITSANLSMLALAIVDLVSCITIHPYIMYKLTHHFNQVWIVTCKIFEFFNHASLAVSMGMLFAIAHDRYRAVCKPYLFSHSFQTFRKLLIFSVVHGVSISAPLLYFYGIRTTTFKNGSSFVTSSLCDYSDEHQNTPPAKIFMLIVLLAFSTFVISMSLIYIKVASTVYKNRKTTPTPIIYTFSGVSRRKNFTGRNNTNSTGNSIIEMDSLPVPALNPVQTSTLASGPPAHKCAKMLFFVTAVFLLSWLPFWTLRILSAVIPEFWIHKSNFEMVMESLLNHLFYLNNAINPFIYAVMNKKFRADLTLFVRRFRRLCQ